MSFDKINTISGGFASMGIILIPSATNRLGSAWSVAPARALLYPSQKVLRLM